MYIGNSPATGDNNSFKILDDISSYTLTFNGSSGSVVSVANDTITQNNHRFLTGQRVTYTAAGTAIGGLTSGNVYFIIKTDYSTFKLATSYSDAVNSIAIDLTALGTGTHSINVAFDGFNTRFKTTYDNGTRTQISRAAQLQISINGVIQQPNDTSTPTNGFGIDLDSVVVFSAAPSASDIFWGNVLANNFPTFDISDNTIDSFTGTGSQVSFALSKTPANSQNVLVTINGVVQYPTDGSTVRSYSVDGNVLIFTDPPAAASVIQVRHIGFAGPTSSNVTGFYGRTGNVGLTTADAINVGSATIGVGAAGTSLLVQGNARITGILTIGTGSITLNGDANTITGISTISAPSISGVATFTTGPVLIGTGTSTGTASQPLQVTGGAYFSGRVGIGTTNTNAVGANDNCSVLSLYSNGANVNARSVLELSNPFTSTNGSVLGDIYFTSARNSTTGFTTEWSLIRSSLTGSPSSFGYGTAIQFFTKDNTAVAGFRESARFDSSANFLIGAATSTGTVTQPLQVTGGAYVSGNTGIGTTNPVTKLQVHNNITTAYANISPTLSNVTNAWINSSPHVSGGTFVGAQYNLPGDGQNRIAYIGAISESASNRKCSLVFGTDEGGNRTEKVRITGDGNVGIGTTNPASTVAASIKATTSNFAIDILGRDADNSSQIRFVNNTQSAVLGSLRHDGTNLIIGNTLNSPLIFNTNNTEVARITGVGSVGIATNNPQSTLAIGGTVTELYNGQFWNLVSQADIGIGASQISVNGMLGDMAFQNSASINVTNANVTSLNGGQLGGSRNMIINGSMVVNQRGFTGAAGTTTNDSYTTDRFVLVHSHDGVVSAGQTTMNSTVGGNAYADGFQNALIFRVTTADASLASSQYQAIAQKIEGYNVQGIKKGTANAQPVTLSFWVRSTTTGTYIAELFDNDNTRQVSQAYTINAANTWEKKVLTFPADTTGVLDNDNARSFDVTWWLAAGSTFTSGTLQTSWGNTIANRAVGQVNLLATAGNDFLLTGVQLEVGDRATEFERRSYGQELQLCQRYFFRSKSEGNNSYLTNFGSNVNTSSARFATALPVELRANPTISYNNVAIDRHTATYSITGLNIFGSFSKNLVGLQATGASGMTQDQPVVLYSSSTNTGYIDYSSEL